MTVSPVFGKLFVPSKLEEATREILLLWFPTYLREVERQHGYPVDGLTVPLERNYTSRNSYDAIAGEDLPRVVIICPGLMTVPLLSGDGEYRAMWRLGVGVACVAPTEDEAKLHCDIYGAAVRGIVLKHGGKAIGGRVNWVDEQYVDLPISEQVKQYRAGSLWFSVDIANVVSNRPKPLTPDADPYEWGTADTVDIDLLKEPNSG